jgi:aldose 1-epimerase
VTAVDLRVWQGEPTVSLRAGGYEATFVPGAGMLTTALRFRGEDYVAWPRPFAQFRSDGKVTAIPLVHPWGNRLESWSYEAAGQHVDLEGLDLQVDDNGLPIHGNLRAAPFAIEHLEAGRLRATFEYGADTERMRAFPFAHRVVVDARLDEHGLGLTTEVEPTGDRAVPISFCWHPYLRVPGSKRREWTLSWPACEHIEVDARVIPTGARTPQPAEVAPVGDRTFDDHYALRTDRTFGAEAGDRGLRLTFDDNYPYAQLYVPERGEFLAIEPMTAPIDALGRGATPMCALGDRFAASFTISCS